MRRTIREDLDDRGDLNYERNAPIRRLQASSFPAAPGLLPGLPSFLGPPIALNRELSSATPLVHRVRYASFIRTPVSAPEILQHDELRLRGVSGQSCRRYQVSSEHGGKKFSLHMISSGE